MPRYRVRQVMETVNEWEVDADSEEAAEEIALGVPPSKSFSEQASYEINDVPAPPEERYWTAQGTFTITQYGTQTAARAEIERRMGDLVDEFEIEEMS